MPLLPATGANKKRRTRTLPDGGIPIATLLKTLRWAGCAKPRLCDAARSI